ncbi:hypothetical protein GW931_03830 [archaeon]|nr:hypothetical protein [archaeon]PJC45716.1 MAG: hypothetical protein CO037_00010 [Candidatus Pacearchaeota archaeon CG_4_9_14_0_2_um_filter_30_8]
MEKKVKIIIVGIALLLVAILLIGTISLLPKEKHSEDNFYFEKPTNSNYISYKPENSADSVMVPWNVQEPTISCRRIR